MSSSKWGHRRVVVVEGVAISYSWSAWSNLTGILWKTEDALVEQKPTACYFPLSIFFTSGQQESPSQQPVSLEGPQGQACTMAVGDLINEAVINTVTLINGGQDKGWTRRPPSPSDGVSAERLFLSHWSICFPHNPQALRRLSTKASA